MKNIIFVLLSLFSIAGYAKVLPLAIEGFLGSSTHFRIDSYYNTDTELVWGETTYFRKNGAQSHIQLYGSYFDKVTLDGWEIREFTLTEYVDGKTCGYFKFDVRFGSVIDGKWYLDKKVLNFRDVRTSNVRKDCKKEPNGDVLFQRNYYQELYCPISYTIESTVNGEMEYCYSVEIDKPLLMPKVCQDSITKWLKVEFGCTGKETYYQMAQKWAIEAKNEAGEDNCEHLVKYKVKNQELNYLTYSIFEEICYKGSAHPQYIENCLSFDKRTGKVITMDFLFLDPNDEALESVIRKEMISQNKEIAFDDEKRLGSPTVGPYIMNGFICFHFLPYEVGCWADGMPSCQLSPSKLSPFLTERGRRLFAK